MITRLNLGELTVHKKRNHSSVPSPISNFFVSKLEDEGRVLCSCFSCLPTVSC